MQIQKLTKFEQQGNRLKYQQLMSANFLPSLVPGLFEYASRNGSEILLLARFGHGTDTLNMEFKNTRVEWWMPCIPVLGLVVHEDNKDDVVKEIITHPQFNNVVEVDYFDDYSFIDVNLIGDIY